jgi:hypothetical protein
MRKIFGGAMLFSALGAAILGGALAWNNTQSVSDSNFVGDVDFSVTFTPNGAVIGPNDDVFKKVGTGDVTNSGFFSLWFQPDLSSVRIDDVNSLDATCLESHFAGRIVAFAELLGEVPPPPNIGSTADGFDVEIATAGSAPSACQSSVVFWTAYITMGTGAP